MFPQIAQIYADASTLIIHPAAYLTDGAVAPLISEIYQPDGVAETREKNLCKSVQSVGTKRMKRICKINELITKLKTYIGI